MDLYEALQARHSIRLFRPDAVDRAVIDRLLGAAASAPSWMNSQPWHFHVATGDTRDAVSEVMALSTLHLKDLEGLRSPEQLEAAERFFATLGDAPVAMALSVPVPTDELDRINAYVAAGCALQNLQLAAAVEGLGCCSITFSFWVRDGLAEVLEVPSDREIVALVVVGWPAEEPRLTSRNTDIASFQD